MLRADTLTRGAFAIHVRRHAKLGLHKTVIKSALPVINAAIASPLVWRVDLGKITCTPPRAKLGAIFRIQAARITLIFTDQHRRQQFLICAREVASAPTIVEALQTVINGHS